MDSVPLLSRPAPASDEWRAVCGSLANLPSPIRYSERKKFSKSCTWLGERVLNLLITPLASDPLL